MGNISKEEYLSNFINTDFDFDMQTPEGNDMVKEIISMWKRGKPLRPRGSSTLGWSNTIGERDGLAASFHLISGLSRSAPECQGRPSEPHTRRRAS